MPSFVPVVDQEKSRSERNDFDAEFAKHRKFDNPHSVSKPLGYSSTNKRGFETGSVGWGVLGEFGSNQKDDGSAAMVTNSGKNKMVKNEKGLWVKASSVGSEEGEVGGENFMEAAGSKSKGKGRGGGISVFASSGRDDVNLTGIPRLMQHRLVSIFTSHPLIPG